MRPLASRLPAWLLALACSGSGLLAQESRPAAPGKLGLVLAGGGARGAAHIGVLKVLEEMRVPVDLIAGTSMGSIVGGLYAYGLSAAELERAMLGIDWEFALGDKPAREHVPFRRKQDDADFLIDFKLGVRDGRLRLPKGLIQGQHALLLFKMLSLHAWKLRSFDELPLPFRAVATDIANGAQVVLGSGDLATAMKASMSIPGAFAPTVIDGRELVDGFVVNNIPIDVAKQMGATRILAVDVGSPLLKPEDLGDPLAITGQMVGIMMQESVAKQKRTLTADDLLIVPDLGEFSTTAFDRVREAIAIGEKAARAQANELRRFAVSEAEYAHYLARQRLRPPGPPRISSIEIQGAERISPDVVRGVMSIRPGEVLDQTRLLQDFERIYGLDHYDLAWFELRADGDQVVLVVRLVERPWGPNYLSFGLRGNVEVGHVTYFDLGTRFTMTGLDSAGSELRAGITLGTNSQLDAEYYRPFAANSPFFAAAHAAGRGYPVREYQDGAFVSESDVLQGDYGADLGVEIARRVELRTGIFGTVGSADTQIGVPSSFPDSFQDAGFVARLTFDTLDNANLPTSGMQVQVSYAVGNESLGADVAYERGSILGVAAAPLGPFAVLLRGELVTALDGTLPAQQEGTLGGLFRLSGLHIDEYRAQHTAMLGLALTHRLGKRSYAGISMETGDQWDQRSAVFGQPLVAGSVFVGMDTPLGPLYVGYGMTEQDQHAAYFLIGRRY